MSLVQETKVYVSRIREFDRNDWVVYTVWIGLMLGLFVSVTAFLAFGSSQGVIWAPYVWNIPIGIFVFVSAIALDTIGHRTIYKEDLARAEALVHHITIAAGISSIVLLCMAYDHRESLRIPAYVMSFLSLTYSLIDEGLHWHRYLNQRSDRVEMWSHFFIFVGHLTMTAAWLFWFENGYPGVAETLAHLKGL